MPCRAVAARAPEDRQDGVRRRHPGQVGRAHRRGDDHPQATCLGRGCVFGHPVRGAVRRDDAHLVRHAQFLEQFEGGGECLEVALAAHDDAHQGCEVSGVAFMAASWLWQARVVKAARRARLRACASSTPASWAPGSMSSAAPRAAPGSWSRALERRQVHPAQPHRRPRHRAHQPHPGRTASSTTSNSCPPACHRSSSSTCRGTVMLPARGPRSRASPRRRGPPRRPNRLTGPDARRRQRAVAGIRPRNARVAGRGSGPLRARLHQGRPGARALLSRRIAELASRLPWPRTRWFSRPRADQHGYRGRAQVARAVLQRAGGGGPRTGPRT